MEQTIMGLLFLAFVVLLVLVYFFSLYLIERKIKKAGGGGTSCMTLAVLFLIFNIGFFILGSYVEGYFKTSRFNREFTQGVDLRQVTVNGEQSFSAQIAIKYKDGKIDKISLVEGTTALSKDGGDKNDK